MKSFASYFKRIDEIVKIAVNAAVLVNEDLPTKQVDTKQFPNPITQTLAKIFTSKGAMDGNPGDDIVATVSAQIPAQTLMPTQSEIFLGKALGMAVGGVAGGDLKAIISKDNYILDGHHRWAATMLSNPSAKVGGLKANLGIGDLVPVLRALGDVFNNPRRGNPGGGDINLYDSKFEDALAIINEGKYISPKFYDKAKAQAWLQSIGGEAELKKRYTALKAKKPPAGAPPRQDMPVIDADKGQEKDAAALLNKGSLDVKKPYA